MINLRRATQADTSLVCELFEEQLHRTPNQGLISEALGNAPSALAFSNDKLVGFVYCAYMAPDIMEIMNILVTDTERANGVGTRMLEFVEEEMPPQVVSMMLANSSLYPDVKGGKLPATSFYIRNGYTVIADTGKTRIF
ncbi:GNAT family N-acetyltransferase [Paenarthrobacter sp. DKR-5]|uniref:GNAT family N-acetyltransferase n=1 Tax=Paenarthrobacter sp. DKR-5 TaxID=2835535 RepID=UPI001BDC4EB4|nr:GNAT family N-acetyltransferase [Paenarthrobacter sp. DKR-5]MBT1003963.1 GNAT family N-acetyltransferase [Paenarthrobacter sp. DKR-5]